MPRKTAKKPAKQADRRPVAVVRRVHGLSARYDLAQTTDDNRRHWENADSLSASAALSPAVRQKLRDRSRYEVSENSWARGIGLTITNDTVGSGPMLQLVGVEKETKKIVETLFWKWAQEIKLAEKLRQLRYARFDSGEAFGIFGTNNGLRGPVTLDLQVIESEQIANPTFDLNPVLNPLDMDSDGILYDSFGNPSVFRKLKMHPGSNSWNNYPTDSVDIDAKYVFHYYRPDRPGQLRGVPDVTAAIGLFAELRRYRAAVIAAAETAAEHAALFTTPAPADGEVQRGEDLPGMWDVINLEKRAGVVLPEGYDVKQLKAEQPTTVYDAFVNSVLREIARCLCVPFHIASLDPSVANMSASYVVGQMYTQERIVDRSELNRLMDQCWEFWLAEASRIPEYLPILPSQIVAQWGWPSLGHHADPQKVASAMETRLSTGMTSFSREYAKDGEDVEEQHELLARDLGKTVEEVREALFNKLFGGGATTPDAPDGPDPELERIKAEADAYGVCVRAGAVTPQTDDETEFRSRLSLPAMSTAARGAWQKDKGVRRPITLQSEDGKSPLAASQNGEPADDDRPNDRPNGKPQAGRFAKG